jgi:hypothetical protein
LALVVIGCATDTTRIPEATPQMALELGVEYGQLERGREVYMAHCNQCHDRIPPGEIDPEIWRGLLPHMAINAELTTTEEEEVLLYLLAAHGTVHGANLQH